MSDKSPTGKVVGRARRAWRLAKLTFLAVVAVLVLIVLFQNYDAQAQMSALFWKAQVALYLPMLVALVVGLVLGFIAAHAFRGGRQRPHG